MKVLATRLNVGHRPQLREIESNRKDEAGWAVQPIHPYFFTNAFPSNSNSAQT